MTTRGVLAKWIYFLLPYLMEFFPPTQMAACFIFFHVELLICHPLLSFLPSQYWPLFIFPGRKETSDWLESSLPAAPFIPSTIRISSWLVHTCWKHAWHNLNIDIKLWVWLGMLTYFLVFVCLWLFIFCVLPSPLPS